MYKQRHVIKRQIIEIIVSDKQSAWPVQQTFSHLFQDYFPSILDRYLSDFSSPDCLHRIDRLELDLGELDGNRLEVDILEKIGPSLQRALHELITSGQVGRNTQEAAKKLAQLQLLEYFLREGHLPWWADNSQRHVPESCLNVLLERDPKALAHLLKTLLPDSRCLHRIISYFDDEQLANILAILNESQKETVYSLVKTMREFEVSLEQFAAIPDSRIRFTRWQSLLQVTTAEEPAITRQGEFFSVILIRWSKLLGLSKEVLTGCIQQLATNPAIHNNAWLSTLRIKSPIDRSSVSHGNETDAKDISEPLNQQESPQTNGISNQWKAESSSTVDSDRMKPTHTQSEQIMGLGMHPNSPLENQAIDDYINFTDTDALYINNAGLCILWPYLATFFEGLELVHNGRFQNLAAQQCAVSLLHYLATGELTTPEYLLPFNKLICGLEINEVFDLEMPLTDAQLTACDDLLTAVIANAPILNKMSHDGFRGSFLLRQGTLSSEAGSWLLRVERETYDIVLERFPWSWQWFKLPWMEHPVRVEW
jgi:hypothetical protein